MARRTEEINQDLIDKGLFFSLNKAQLARHYISNDLETDVFNLDIERVLKIIGEQYELEGLADEEEGIYHLVAHEIMGIKRDIEPYQAFNQEVFQVMKDLKTIDLMIKEFRIQKELESNNKYTKRKYEYLVEKLNFAKEEICNYITEGMNNYVYKKVKAYKQTPINFGQEINFKKNLEVPYPFRGNEDDYKMSVFDGLKYKLKFMSSSEKAEIKILYSEDKLEFNKRIDSYISSNKIEEEVLLIIKENHILSKRSMLEKAIDIYKDGQTELFCQIIPLQIEGIIYDYCIELGITRSDIDSGSITKKVEKIISKDKSFKCHEYFKYEFNELRNKAAHGRLHEGVNYKDTANMLILDLMYLCEFVNSSNATVINKMRNLVKEIEKSKVENDHVYADLLALEFMNLYINNPLPSFYNSNTEIAKILEYIHSDSLLGTIRLHTMLPALFSKEEINNMKNILIYLKKNQDDLKEECICLLKELSETNK
ncbi:hypothetical protein P9Z56_29165 [Bacillus cereus]|nr:hypothetical protein [Bacillus cereus]MEC2758416.1 hypothetical protein [Bacillus cereus]MEC2830218.1 hypothetical protein [Bacillus cereus]